MDFVKSAGVFFVGLVVGTFACAFLLHPPLQSSDWASWAQAFGTVTAIFGAYAIARHQIRAEKDRRAESERIARAKELLALQQIAAELAQMCVLANFEKSNLVEGTIYPNSANEFQAIADTLAGFPVAVVTALGEMEVLLRMRRIAVASSQIFRDDHAIKGDQFVVRHRTKFLKFNSDCSSFSLSLQKRVEEEAPGRFTDKLRTHL